MHIGHLSIRMSSEGYCYHITLVTSRSCEELFTLFKIVNKKANLNGDLACYLVTMEIDECWFNTHSHMFSFAEQNGAKINLSDSDMYITR